MKKKSFTEIPDEKMSGIYIHFLNPKKGRMCLDLTMIRNLSIFLVRMKFIIVLNLLVLII